MVQTHQPHGVVIFYTITVSTVSFLLSGLSSQTFYHCTRARPELIGVREFRSPRIDFIIPTVRADHHHNSERCLVKNTTGKSSCYTPYRGQAILVTELVNTHVDTTNRLQTCTDSDVLIIVNLLCIGLCVLVHSLFIVHKT
jgi:hypothetical protein